MQHAAEHEHVALVPVPIDKVTSKTSERSMGKFLGTSTRTYVFSGRRFLVLTLNFTRSTGWPVVFDWAPSNTIVACCILLGTRLMPGRGSWIIQLLVPHSLSINSTLKLPCSPSNTGLMILEISKLNVVPLSSLQAPIMKTLMRDRYELSKEAKFSEHS